MIVKGSTVEMVLDRPIVLHEQDVDFTNAPPRPRQLAAGSDKGGLY